ncbi:malto-oligosyltrehalose trehalohydrolase [Dyadobacter subterraneus]|uniref:Malto-oligosyltrehalose trehalohydrolase n=1 Tax=Dyadobacter subterraneus TaxID=2773304 RepID=A0ABR9WFE3_9BACT|nr:malto-oligosyltrehalose trehalohydrolase [Dyadobacter subterraneus]MBE9464231.1 malto-oligosyltrehalose trehalohydrolase [Dyadobacter subterraneus]
MRKLGANYSGDQCVFTVWAPKKETMQLQLISSETELLEMQKNDEGYFHLTVDNVLPGAQYFFKPEGTEKGIPDPASQFQPDGVHGPSAVVDQHAYQWKTNWSGLPLKDLIFYELHVGTFTKEGTFEAIIPLLDDLAETGINAIELMPVSQFPGNRNWGYDGVFPYAVQNSYGGPEKLKLLVDAAHERGIAVFLDVVFNHLGPEGNYAGEFGPYFTDTYCTPWGNAINFDGAWSDGVREYFAGVISHFYEHYHLDGLRVDAVHMMFDNGAVNFWEMVSVELDQLREKLGRSFYLIAESDLNSPKTVKLPENGGLGFNVQWLDDFHHALYVLLDKEGQSRYEDFGKMEQLAKAYTDGFVHSGEYVKFRNRKHGASSAGLPGETFLVFNQNHDQIGNRVGGERLSMLVNFDRQKLAAAAMLLAPYLPMFFMGEEYGADTPFFYFVSHSEEDLIKMVVEGRRKEFENYKWETDPPNPQEEQTFNNSKLDWEKRKTGRYLVMLNWNKELIKLRKTHPALKNFNKNDVRVTLFGPIGFALHRKSSDQKQELLCIFNLSEKESSFNIPERDGNWNKIIDSTEKIWLETESEEAYSYPQFLNSGDLLVVKGLSIVVYDLTVT